MSKNNNKNKGKKENKNASSAIKTEYDFIPLSDSFYIPTWSVSHDIPCCKNPLSGKIQLHIVTCSPMVVRHEQEMEKMDGVYFIPATSLKGCVRNVLEIMSFSKLKTRYKKYCNVPQQYNNKRDLSEYIFGYVDDKRSLKGRVQIGNAFCISTNVCALAPKTIVFGNPFYNNDTKKYAKHLYLENKEIEGEKKEIIKGWKRYSVKKKFVEPDDKKGSQTTTTTFIAIKENAEFLAEVSYFNLNEIELGALLCAITFDNTPHCYHQIGSGKGLGYGKVSMQILNFTGFESYIKKFKDALFVGGVKEEDLRIRFEKLKSLSFDGDYMNEEFIKQFISQYICERKYEQAKMWKKRLSEINRQESDSYNIDALIVTDNNQQKRETKTFTPTSLNIGDTVKAFCFADKKVHIAENEYDINLVVGKEYGIKSTSLIGKEINVIIKQISKSGKIIQVGYV